LLNELADVESELDEVTYFFSCSNFLVKLSASLWRRWASLSYMAVCPMREP